MSRILARGDLGIIEETSELPAIGPNTYVLIERERNGMVETTLRKVERGADGKILLKTHSHNPKYADVITYPGKGDAIRIRAKLIGKQTSIL